MDRSESTIDHAQMLEGLNVPKSVLDNWQKIVDLAAVLLDVPTATISRLHPKSFEIIVSSRNEENQISAGLFCDLGAGYYCDAVFENNNRVLIPNALKDPQWDDGPDLEFGLISYLGYPLSWPTGAIFGTICVLDDKENHFSQTYIKLIEQFRLSIQLTLETIFDKHILSEENEKLASSNLKLKSAKSAAEDASVANLAKNEFLTAVSHELRTPMHGILGGIEIVKYDSVEPISSTLELIHRSAAEMMLLVNDILTYTEIQSGDLRTKKVNSNPWSIAQTLYRRYKPICDAKGLTLKWKIDQKLDKWLKLDEDKLITVLDKLLDNAVSFTDSGDITVSANLNLAPKTWALEFTIQDSGIGIHHNDSEKLFSPFQQKEGGFQRRYGGLGIGLTISKKLVKAMNGSLILDSEEGVGSTFKVSIPVTSGVESTMQDVVTDPLALATFPILVVEDNIVNQKIMVKMLEKMGYHCFVANNGEEALITLELEPVSLILLDLQMPVMDGFTCTRRVREYNDHRCKIPIVAITANQMEVDKELCFKSGMNEYLQKPVAFDTLKETISRYVGPVIGQLSNETIADMKRH